MIRKRVRFLTGLAAAVLSAGCQDELASPTKGFIEVDTGSEHSRVIVAKVRRYLELERAGTWRGSLPVWPYVLFVTTTGVRAAFRRNSRLG